MRGRDCLFFFWRRSAFSSAMKAFSLASRLSPRASATFSRSSDCVLINLSTVPSRLGHARFEVAMGA